MKNPLNKQQEYFRHLLPYFVTLVLLSAFYWRSDYKYLLNIFSDDGYFYFSVAENIVKGNGPTFDRVNETNGFNPLWMIILLPIYKAVQVFSLDHISALRVLLSIHFVMVFCLFYFLFRLLRNFLNGSLFVIHACLIYAFYYWGFNNVGMETLVYTLLLTILLEDLFKINRYHDLSERKWKTGTVIALMVMTRIDSVILAPILCLFLFSKLRKQDGFSYYVFLPVLLPLVLSLGSYFIYNHAYFGHISPVNSYLKNSFPLFSFGQAFRHMMGLDLSSLAHLTQFLISFVISLLYAIMAIPKLWKIAGGLDWFEKERMGVLVMMSLYFTAYMVVLFLFMDRGFGGWYLAAGNLSTLMIISFIVGKTKLRRPSMKVFGSLVILCMMSGFGWYAISYRISLIPRRQEAVEMIEYIKKNIEDSAIIHAYDSSGRLNYFSRRKVINGDGLINSYLYQDYLEKGLLHEYLKYHKVDYLINKDGHLEDNGMTYRIKYKGKRNASYLEVQKRHEVKRTTNGEFVMFNLKNI